MRNLLLVLLSFVLYGAQAWCVDTGPGAIRVGSDLTWSTDIGSTSPDNIQTAPLFSFRVSSVVTRQDDGSTTYLITGLGTGGFLSEHPISWYESKSYPSVTNVQVQLILSETSTASQSLCSQEQFLKRECGTLAPDTGTILVKSGGVVFFRTLNCSFSMKTCFGGRNGLISIP